MPRTSRRQRMLFYFNAYSIPRPRPVAVRTPRPAVPPDQHSRARMLRHIQNIQILALEDPAFAEQLLTATELWARSPRSPFE
jgi:hypothetical protein